jgi:hypothetical protein
LSDTPRDFTLERVNRLTLAIADLTESHASQGWQFMAMMPRLLEHLERIEAHTVAMGKDLRELASEQVLLGNRVENAFSRALRTNIRLDEIEDEGA